MSTYLIAGAIEKFSKDISNAISEKNRIEKDKLTFEREKFEFNKQQGKQQKECNQPPTEYPPELHSNGCVHDWKLAGRLFGTKSRYTMWLCSKCNEEHTYKTYQDEDNKWVTHII